MILWLSIALFFAILRLGPILRIGGVPHPDVLLPKHYLDSWFPWIFKAFWDTTYFQIGILLPLAMLFCYAVRGLLNAMAPRLRVATLAIILVAIAFEYYRPPPRNYTSVPAGSNWINWMASEDNQDDIHVINLPMGRSHSKLYGFYQSINGYPQVEGLASRTPSEAYDFIDNNLLLSAWRSGNRVNCEPDNEDEYVANLGPTNCQRFHAYRCASRANQQRGGLRQLHVCDLCIRKRPGRHLPRGRFAPKLLRNDDPGYTYI